MIVVPGHYYYLRPSRNIVRGQAVTPSGAFDTPEYNANWLTDDRPAWPGHWAPGAWGASIAAAGDVQLIALGNTSLDDDVAAPGLGTLPVAATSPNGAVFNPYLLLASPATVGSVDISGTNTLDTYISIVFAGEPESIPSLKLGTYWEEPDDQAPDDVGGDFLNVLNHDDGIEFKRFGGSQTYTNAQKVQIEDWWRDQRTNSRPSVMIINGEARVVLLLKPHFAVNVRDGTWDADLSWIELPRYRWIL